MILSHAHRFIFLKTNKTAGTSTEIALSKFCGPDDVITPISPEDELLRGKLGFSAPQNYACQRAGSEEVTFYNHMPAAEIRAAIDPAIWHGYFKFCVERNPWDRMVSLYYWRCRSEPRPSIQEFLDSDVPADLKRRGSEIYTIDGKVVVDHIVRYENLDAELEDIRLRLGIPERLVLPRAKSRFREGGRDYREILGHAERDAIAAMFSEEITRFGYSF